MDRDQRQRRVGEWCAEVFGVGQASSLPQRAVRMLEEAIELYQACGGDLAMAHKLLDFVFARPIGEINQELGGVGVSVLALAEAAALSADMAEFREIDRVLGKPISHFRERNEAKNKAGFLAGGIADAIGVPMVSAPQTKAVRVKKVVIDCLGCEPEKVADDALLVEDLGADSLDRNELAMLFEDEFGCEIGDHDMAQLIRVKDAVDLIERLCP